MIKKISLFILLIATLTLVACGENMDKEIKNGISGSGDSKYTATALDVSTLDDSNRPFVTIEMADGQIIEIKLIPEIAPNTVNNFLTLASDGFYDGLTFHRIIPKFMIQAGDPSGDGSGGPGYTIRDEFYKLDEENLSVEYLSHTRGVLSMAKQTAPDTAGSQFFIMHEDSSDLNGSYAAFGYVTQGLDVIDVLSQVKTGEYDKPIEAVVIKSIKVNLNGYDLKKPETIKNDF